MHVVDLQCEQVRRDLGESVQLIGINFAIFEEILQLEILESIGPGLFEEEIQKFVDDPWWVAAQRSVFVPTKINGCNLTFILLIHDGNSADHQALTDLILNDLKVPTLNPLADQTSIKFDHAFKSAQLLVPFRHLVLVLQPLHVRQQ